jgi:hypothetical protein
MFVSVRAIHSVKLRQQWTTVLMLDFSFQARLTIAVAHCLSKLGFQIDKAFDFACTSVSLRLSIDCTSEQA